MGLQKFGMVQLEVGNAFLGQGEDPSCLGSCVPAGQQVGLRSSSLMAPGG